MEFVMGFLCGLFLAGACILLVGFLCPTWKVPRAGVRVELSAGESALWVKLTVYRGVRHLDSPLYVGAVAGYLNKDWLSHDTGAGVVSCRISDATWDAEGWSPC